MSDYRPSPTGWVRTQVEAIEAAGTTDGVQVMDRPVILMTMTGAKSGATLKVPVMRVEHEGSYAAVASKGGAPDNPQWFHNLVANPDITVQDGADVLPMRARRIDGEERAGWWERCVAAFPQYVEYQANTDRQIPVFVLEPR